jgi:hypothetical protein
MNKVTQNISQENLIEILKDIDKGTFVSIETLTKVRMKKTDNPFYEKVQKYSRKNVRPIPDYEKRMKKTNEEFVVAENKVGQHISPCVIFNEKYNKHYFSYETFDNSHIETKYIDENGNPIEKELFQPFLPTYNNDRDVKIFSVGVENIKSISYKGVKYEVD